MSISKICCEVKLMGIPVSRDTLQNNTSKYDLVKNKC